VLGQGQSAHDCKMDDAKAIPEQPSTPATGEAQPAPTVSLRTLRAATEIDAISRTLEQTGWNRKRAAELLSISYRGLLYKIRQHNITPSTRVQLSSFPEP
jgi:DNA-binding NtrC family response regulator